MKKQHGGLSLFLGACVVFLVLLCLPVGRGYTDSNTGTLHLAGSSTAALLAATPPMGWNSWDGYGTTINEEQVKANAAWLATHLKPSGWQYVVVDMEWFVNNPTPEGNSKNSTYALDANGRYTPAENRFPSAAGGKGFKALADYIHSLGLKFGIHILRGVPKQAVKANAPACTLPMQRTPAKLARGIPTISAATQANPQHRPTTIPSRLFTLAGAST